MPGDELTRPVRVLIAGAWDPFVRSVETVLVGDERIEIVGSGRDALEALGLAAWLSPDVVLIDLDSAGVDGVEATRRLRALVPATSVLLLTASGSPEESDRAASAGADAYLTKDRISPELVGAIVEAASRRARPWGTRSRTLA